jgi:hypothetical protein
MGRVTRFQVMATLQAARARALGLEPEEAKSWGLNRALFYAAAKRGWANARALGAKRPIIGEFEQARRHGDEVFYLGNEKAFVDPGRDLRFKFGDEVQHAEDFDRQVIRRFDNWQEAWSEAVGIIRSADPRDLESQSRFFNRVYKPRRDELSKKWSRLGAVMANARVQKRAA